MVVPDCTPVLACALLLSLHCTVGGNSMEPEGVPAALDVRVASFWGCAAEPGLRLSIEVLCDADPTCVERVVNLVSRSAAVDGRGRSTRLAQQDLALRLDGAEFALEGDVRTRLASGARTVFVPSTELKAAFGAARGFAAVMRDVHARCSQLNDDAH